MAVPEPGICSRMSEEQRVIGLIEGFYGPPWTWRHRHEVCTAVAGAGMDTYVYAPKDDPYHREKWRDPYPKHQIEALGRFVEECPLRVGVAIAPGLSMDSDDDADRAALLAKVDQMLTTGSDLLLLCFDDIEPAPELGARHAALVNWLRERLDGDVELVLVPLHYTGTRSSAYLRDLHALDRSVPIVWTGEAVVNQTITIDDALAWSDVMEGRAPLLWDNTPVNDAVMSDRLFTGPLRGRQPGLMQHLSGYLANPMVQPGPSIAPLCSAAAWARGADPVDAWRDACGEDLVFHQACDAEYPARLADAALGGDAVALQELTEWFDRAASLDASGLGEDVDTWVQQVRTEAAVGRDACRLLSVPGEEAALVAPLLYLSWPALRTSTVQVLGGRGAVLPYMTQDEQSRWVALAQSYVPPASVVDRLVAAVFDRVHAGS